jgi:phosphodiesterase/alkaline phosphatase D-like protein
VSYRLDLTDSATGKDLGFYDGRVSFRLNKDGKVEKHLSLIQGPLINTSSDDTSTATISFETDEISTAVLFVKKKKGEELGPFESKLAGTRHEIQVFGLKPDTEYLYYVEASNEQIGKAVTRKYMFRSAPAKGRSPVVFAFMSDSREGMGGGERAYMGLNLHVLSTCVRDAYRRGAQFLVFGGDLINGYNSDVEDFRLQLKAWKQAVEGFWRTRPVFTAMGNHEALINVFKDGTRAGLALDKWPYERQSAETIFAEEFMNPKNGPEPSDPRRPRYRENVYSFQYGPATLIAFNNNYWYTTCNYKKPETCRCKDFGGSPEGYIMEDQLFWIEEVIARADEDVTTKYIFLFAQEPVFPCGGHVTDAMWWNGNNQIRAYSKNSETALVEPEPLGIVEVRNRLWRAVAQSKKVAAVMTGDEHAYHRTLLSSRTPVGLFPRDDLDGDGVLDRFSTHPDFTNPTWHITAGTAGAPFYNREETPWEPSVFSSQSGYLLIKIQEERVSSQFITVTGQVLDKVSDLLAVKQRAR